MTPFCCQFDVTVRRWNRFKFELFCVSCFVRFQFCVLFSLFTAMSRFNWHKSCSICQQFTIDWTVNYYYFSYAKLLQMMNIGNRAPGMPEYWSKLSISKQRTIKLCLVTILQVNFLRTSRDQTQIRQITFDVRCIVRAGINWNQSKSIIWSCC